MKMNFRKKNIFIIEYNLIDLHYEQDSLIVPSRS